MIALTVIVKDEVEDLDRCLGSVKDVEIYVAITSKSKQKELEEIVAKYHGRSYFYEWHDDYSAARNFIMSKVPADCEYIMYLDADDTIAGDIDEITTDVVYVPYKVGVLDFTTIRVVKNNGHWRWQGRIHELLVSDIPFTHSQSEWSVQHHEKTHPSRDSWDTKLRILQSEYSQSARTAYYYAREIASEGKTDEAIKAYQAYLKLPGWLEEQYVANHALSDLYRFKNDLNASIKQDLNGLLLIPDARDSFFGIAESYYYLKEWSKVIVWTELGIHIPVRKWLMIHDKNEELFNWMIYYVVALDNVGRTHDALKYTQLALQISPQDSYHVENLTYLKNKLGIL